MREQRDMPSGVLLVDKEPDMTSHDAVAIARRQLNMKKIGHCGTLDPMATGLLILVVGKATKLSDALMSEHKVYEGSMQLGITTNSQDREGEVLEEKKVEGILEEDITRAFGQFEGDFEQIPPMVSAIKVNGVALYKLARKGKEVERKPRPVTVYESNIHRIDGVNIDFRVKCTKGFYVRTYAHDIGQVLGTGAHLTALRRTYSGDFDLSRAVPASELKVASRESLISRLITLEQIAEMKGISLT